MKDLWKLNLMTMVFYIAIKMPMNPSMELLEIVAKSAVTGLYIMFFYVYASELEY